ncbi:uncharacterized protein LOC110695992 [Chenopodium quinoa]|uniref:uncharacterized protein LOC110695992 n=1 Tax=Chenopodium quinoa TaxID=63459 RepID=UPI000B775BCC|nr:uncharacterized protein LOC110695992 [Chenopodium quinoa]
MDFLLKNHVLLACFCFLILLPGFSFSTVKQCGNTITNLSTKTLRYEFLTSKNETWKREIMSQNHHDHDHLTPTDEVAWSNLNPRKLLLRQEDEFNWNVLYKKIKYSKHNLKGNFLNEIPLHNVRLDPQSFYGRAQQTNLEYLLLLNVDSLAWSFRKTAGLPTPGTPYGGWEAPDSELRGHFVGHYLSATAHMWASTHNETIRANMGALVSSLKECQDAMNTGYLSAFPTEFFDRYEALQYVWAPYYTIHKVMAGLLDQYNFANNTQALQMVTSMANYFYLRAQNVVKHYTIERLYDAQNEETGGMNDVLYKLYTVTGDQKHLLLAHLFDKPCFLGLLAMKVNDLSGFHSNTHIPIVVGAQNRYEITGDELYKEMGTFFLDVVNSTHSYATGGTSYNEAWQDPMRLGDILNVENEESCTTYNMLKVSRNLFRWTKQVMYADYYERALTNGVLGIQKGTEPGVMIYMLPLGHGVSKGKSFHGWGDQFNSFWCCYGTGIESFSKLGDSIYFEETTNVPGLYVIQYIPSSLDWTAAQISLIQVVDDVTSLNQSLKVKLTVSAKKASKIATLNLRIPSWTSSSGSKASLNGNNLPLPSPGSFLNISKSWVNGDEIILEFPLVLRTEFLKDDRPEYASLQAILYGPYLLVGLSNGDYDIQTGSVKSISDWITPIPADYNSYLVSFAKENGNTTFFVSKYNQALTMLGSHQAMNDSYVQSTFRLILIDPSPSQIKSAGPTSLIGKVVMLEPFDLPGLVVAHQGVGKILTITGANHNKQSAEFLIEKGLNGRVGTISLKTKEGCFVYGDSSSKTNLSLKLSCENKTSDPSFRDAVSFVWNEGFKKYSPISFLAKGLRKSYILEPLLEMRDEYYNVYFNVIM